MRLFLDTSDINEIKDLSNKVAGFTTNPTLMRKAGVKDYEKWAREVAEIAGDRPVSFEVIADEFDEMERQAHKISKWGRYVYIKIPVTNTKGVKTTPLVSRLREDGIRVNLTAVTSEYFIPDTDPLTPMIISIFCGRIADTGRDPKAYFGEAIKSRPVNVDFLWASPREVFNIYEAEHVGADIITVTPEVFRKFGKMQGYDLSQLSLDTVKMFYNDAKESGYKL